MKRKPKGNQLFGGSTPAILGDTHISIRSQLKHHFLDQLQLSFQDTPTSCIRLFHVPNPLGRHASPCLGAKARTTLLLPRKGKCPVGGLFQGTSIRLVGPHSKKWLKQPMEKDNVGKTSEHTIPAHRFSGSTCHSHQGPPHVVSSTKDKSLQAVWANLE